MFVSWAVTHAVRRRAAKWGLVDQPGVRKVHTTPTPLGGGLAIWAGVVAPLAAGQLLLWLLLDGKSAGLSDFVAAIPVPEFVVPHLSGLWQQSGKLWVLLAAGTLLMLLGLADDLRGLPWRLRLGVQTALAAAIVTGEWRFTLFIDAPWLTGAVSVLWIVGLINSFNMLDNMDGLSSGIAAIAASLLAAVMLLAPDPLTRQPQLFTGGFLLVLVGALLGFLWHNRPPAKIFMGDAGSYFIGFLLAMMTIIATFAVGEAPKRHAILAPLCVLAVPLYDTITVVIIRLRAGKSPFEGDKNHFSHRLVDLGLTRTQAVLTIYLTTATTGLGALLLYQVDGLGACIILLLVACVLTVIGILETTARRKLRGVG
ncbi:MAG: undecaprenyl/decaprenyl-phosphate alpha-N-acetylglucosaminyl 1-phosphate transferase [Planctomycetes bacterium]|nr:undecaprenyl/decaprenyl-phosphate alpha-N-acetylglucosaminyl 1-phosphate transferase [Planctomycetota bacterium]